MKDKISLMLYKVEFHLLDQDEKQNVLNKIKIKCTNCENDSTYINEKGLIFCDDCSFRAKQSFRYKYRKMKIYEMNLIKNGKQIQAF